MATVKVDKSNFQNTTKWKNNDRDGVYKISVTAGNVSGTPSTGDRTLYIQKIVSQNRNAVLGISSSACTTTTCTFYKGQSYTVTLYVTKVDFQGKRVDAIRVDGPVGQAAAPPKPVAVLETELDESEIAF